jgi:hypothetical protein
MKVVSLILSAKEKLEKNSTTFQQFYPHFKASLALSLFHIAILIVV